MNLTNPRDPSEVTVTLIPDTGILYADAMNLSRTAKRYKRLAKQYDDVGSELAPFYEKLYRTIDDAANELMTFRNALNEGII